MNKVAFSSFTDKLLQSIDTIITPKYEPTGVQEDIIIPVGMGNYDIILVLSANKTGKTRTAAEIMKNIMWSHDPEWFDYPLYREWPFPKQFRITGTKENTKFGGPIQNEIKAVWPSGEYNASKLGKNYQCSFQTNTGWVGDMLTYNQDPDEYEGPLCGIIWSDEPPKSNLIGAINSRFSKGGIWLLTMTPISCGVFLDEMEDIRQRGKKIHYVSCDITQNSISQGKPNHKGTKRGLMTDQEIVSYAAGIPNAERESRLHGKASRKSGKIYPMFDRSVHVKEFNIDSDYAKKWNCYCAIDPHRKYYPYISWWAFTPDEKHICFNEWPTKETLGGYYDEQRTDVICPHDVEKLSKFIKIMDMQDYGLNIMGRTMDPRFAKGTENEFGNTTSGLIGQYLDHDLQFELPPFEQISEQRNTIQNLLHHDTQRPMSEFNEPAMYVMPHCQNMIRALERHSWDDTDKEKESEKYKDPIDTIRYYLAYTEHKPWKDPNPPKKKGNQKKSKSIFATVSESIV